MNSMSFDAQDPRVVMMPVTRADAQNWVAKFTACRPTPYKFQDAVLIGANGGYYGRMQFSDRTEHAAIREAGPQFTEGIVRQIQPVARRSGFQPQRRIAGHHGQQHLLPDHSPFHRAATFPFNQNLASRHTSETLSELYSYVFQLPLRLQ